MADVNEETRLREELAEARRERDNARAALSGGWEAMYVALRKLREWFAPEESEDEAAQMAIIESALARAEGDVAPSAATARATAAESEVASLKGSLASANDKALMRGRAAHEAQEKLRAAESALAEAHAECLRGYTRYELTTYLRSNVVGEIFPILDAALARAGEQADTKGSAGELGDRSGHAAIEPGPAPSRNAGEQGPTCTCRRTETFIENRGNCPEHPAPSRFPDHNSAAGPVWRDPITPAPQPPPGVMAGIEEMQRHPPLSVGCGNPATWRAGEPASSGQEVVGGSRRFGKTESLKQAALEAVARNPDAVIAWASPRAGPDQPWHAPATPPPGEQGKGGGEGLREIALHRMLEKATVRIEILLSRMRGCDDEVRRGNRGDTDGHALSLFEGDSWVEEQRGLLLSTAISHLAPAQPANPAGGVIQPAVGPAQDGAGADLPRSDLADADRRNVVRSLAQWFRNGPVRALLNTYVADQIERWAPRESKASRALAAPQSQEQEQAGEAGGTAAPCNPRSTRSPATATGSELRQPSEGIPLIGHDYVPTPHPAVDACDKRVSDDPDGPSRQCGRPRREHQG